ncbi:hypothetical protein BYT27DRAFT_7253504 [Phlegmacium glaucopus]|nr:hypothetical protein BYT27DRAFT_7253504 [Phlegmacium glaucopus]
MSNTSDNNANDNNANDVNNNTNDANDYLTARALDRHQLSRQRYQVAEVTTTHPLLVSTLVINDLALFPIIIVDQATHKFQVSAFSTSAAASFGITALQILGYIEEARCLRSLLTLPRAQPDTPSANNHDSFPVTTFQVGLNIRSAEAIPPTIVIHECTSFLKINCAAVG